MLKKPKILVVGSFMMDLIASTTRAPNSGETGELKYRVKYGNPVEDESPQPMIPSAEDFWCSGEIQSGRVAG